MTDFVALFSGCYVACSSALTSHYERTFLGGRGKCMVKIGRSVDLASRLRELNGEQTERASQRGWKIIEPYAGLDDWTMWRIKQNLDGEALETMEWSLQSNFSRNPVELNRETRKTMSGDARLKDSEELFVADIAELKRLFPTIVDPRAEERLAS